MRVTTWNVNGLRAALRKGFADHLAQLAPDVVLLQEVRSLPEQLPEAWQDPVGWHVHWHPAKKKGYAGTAILSRFPMKIVSTGLDQQEDQEGRVVHALIEGIHVICAYLPSGSSGEERQQEKDRWLTDALPWLTRLARKKQPVVIGGDLNVAHTEQDLYYAKGNAKSSGFLPHERAWFGDVLRAGWHDFVREHYGDRDGPYSWWSNRGKARELDRGWRIDYLLGNAAAHQRFRDAHIHRAGGLAVSDHAPVTINLK